MISDTLLLVVAFYISIKAISNTLINTFIQIPINNYTFTLIEGTPIIIFIIGLRFAYKINTVIRVIALLKFIVKQNFIDRIIHYIIYLKSTLRNIISIL